MPPHIRTTHGGMPNPISKICASFVFGIAIFIISTIALWWNEGNYVNTNAQYHALVSVARPADAQAKPGDVIIVNGSVSSTSTLHDDVTEVSANALQLERKVEMYQYREEEKEKDDRNTNYNSNSQVSTRVTVTEGWFESPQPTITGRYNNPPFEVRSAVHAVDTRTVKVADKWGLDRVSMQELLSNAESKTVDVTATSQTPSKHTSLVKRTGCAGGKLGPYYCSVPSSEQGLVMLSKSKQPEYTAPRVGDYRVRMSVKVPTGAHTEPITIVAQYATSNGQPVLKPYKVDDDSIVMAMEGEMTLTEILKEYQHKLAAQTWLIRVLGSGGNIIAFLVLLSPLTDMFGSAWLSWTGIGTLVSCGGCLIGTAVSLVIIALAYMRFRPWLVLVIVAAVVYRMYRKRQQLHNAPPPAPEESHHD